MKNLLSSLRAFSSSGALSLSKASRRRRLARALQIESLETRLAMAFSMGASATTLYEGGSDYTGTQYPIKTTLGFGNTPTPPFDSFSFIVSITGQTDAYQVGTLGTVTEVSPTLRQISFSSIPSNPAFSIEALQDENYAISGDISDYADEVIDVSAVLTYKLQGQSNTQTESQSQQLTLVDNDFTKQLTLAAVDNGAIEPHSAFYAPSGTINKGIYRLTIPSEWRGGTVTLQTSGTATDGSDYTLALAQSYTNTVLTKSGTNDYSLSIPSRASGAGYSQIDINLTALADTFEADSNETAILSFSPAVQSFLASVTVVAQPGGLTNEYHIDTQGSGTVTLVDNVEGVNLTATPTTEKEYTIEPLDMANLFVRPDTAGEILSLNGRTLYFETTVGAANQSGKKNSAIPGVDYVLMNTLTNTEVLFAPITTGSSTYRSTEFTVGGVTEIKFRIEPINDRLVEDDETATFVLFSKETATNNITNEGQSTVTIQELYVETKTDGNIKPEKECNCSCACSNGMRIESYSSNGTTEVKSSIMPLGFGHTPGVNSPAIAVKIGFLLPKDKAIPTLIVGTLEVARPESHSTTAGSAITGLGVAKLANFTIDTAGSAPGDILWISAYMDVSYFNAIGYYGINGNASGDFVLPIQVTAYPNDFVPAATTDQRFTGWLGTHNAVVVNQSQSDLSSTPAVPTPTTSGLTTLPPPSNKANPVGPSGFSVFNLPRAILNAKFVVPRTASTIVYDTEVVDGKQIKRVGNAVRYRGEVDVKLGTVLVYPDGSSTVYFDGESPYSMSTVSGSTVTDRYGDKLVFNSDGRLTQKISATGNTTSITYDAAGWIKSMVEADGDRWDISKTSEQLDANQGPVYIAFNAIHVTDRANPTSSQNRSVSMVWNQSGTSAYGNSGSFVITGVDPDGTGSRKALQETFLINGGAMTRVERGEAGAAATQWFNVGYASIAGASTSHPGRLASSITRQDGGTILMEAPIFLDNGYMLSDGVTFYRTTNSSSSIPASNKIVAVNIDASIMPYETGLASRTDWNGNRTIYRVDSRGRTLNTWDPIQVESVLRDQLPVGNNAAQNTAFINSLALDSALMQERFLGTSYDNLSYKIARAQANKDTRGVILTGKDYGEALQNGTPDPDNFVRRDFAAIDQVDGTQVAQMTTRSYTTDKNVASETAPTLRATSIQYNQQFDVPTKWIDETGTVTQQTVSATTGLVTQRTTTAVKSYSPRYNSTSPLDVDADGDVDSTDLSLATASQTASPAVDMTVSGPSYFDVNGDGVITTADASEISTYLALPQPKTPPTGSDLVSQATITYLTTAGLPVGLVGEVVESTGRTSGDRKTVYTYYNNSSLASHGLVQTITDVGLNGAASSTTSFAYDAYGRLSTVTDAGGRVTNYYYDATDRVTAILYPDADGSGPLLSTLQRFDYDTFGSVIATETISSVVDPSVTSGAQLLVTTLVDGYRYDSLERLVESQEQRGTIKWYLYRDSSGVLQRTVTKATALAGTTVDLTTLTDLASSNAAVLNSPLTGAPNSPGNSTKYPGLNTGYVYDKNGNVLSTTQIDKLVGSSTTQLTEIIYDRLNRPIEVITPNPSAGLTTTTDDIRAASGGFKTSFVYDNVGNLIKVTDPLGNVTRYTYDSLNRLVRETLADGSYTTLSYAANGSSWTITSTDAEGRTVNAKSDALGRIATITGDASNLTYKYWVDGSLKSVTDERGAVTQYDYDNKGQLIKVTAADGSYVTWVYSTDGLITAQSDALARLTSFEYDTGGNLLKQIEPDPDGAGSLVSSYEFYRYDSLGNLTIAGNATNDTTSSAYVTGASPDRYVRDGRFRKSQVYDGRNQLTTIAYDNFDNLKSITTPGSSVTNYTYNTLNQLVSESQVYASPAQTLSRTYSYDGAGNIRSQVDRNGRSILYDYDDLYQLTRETWKTGSTTDRTTDFTYDDVGNLLTVDDSLATWGTDFVFSYDTRNQLQLEKQTIPSIGTSVVLDRDFDTVGNRTRLAANFGGTFTPASNLSSTATSSIAGGISDFSTSFAFDLRHRLTSIGQGPQSGGNAVSPKYVTMDFNASSQLTDIHRYSDSSAVAANMEAHSRLTYDSAGKLTRITHASGEIGAGQSWSGTSTLPASLTSAQMIGAYNLTYDSADRLLYFRSYTDAFRQAYTYTTNDELRYTSAIAISGITTSTTLPASETTSFDGAGNEYIDNDLSAPSAPSGNHNRITDDGDYTYLYDNEGNTIQKTSTDTGAVTLYAWDYRNRLVQVQQKASATGAVLKTIEYNYDWFGRRTVKRLDGNGDGTFEKYWAYVNDAESEVLELEDSDGQGTSQSFRVSNRFLQGDAVDMVLADEQYASGAGFQLGSSSANSTQGETLWTLGDHQGSIRDVVDNNGIVRQHLVYSAWGVRLQEFDRDASGNSIASNNSAAIDELFGYTGRDWDADANLQYNRARWYDPQMKRWLSQDPIGFAAGDWNLYRYVGSSATNGTDPSGLLDRNNYDPESQKMLDKIGDLNAPNYQALLDLQRKGKASINYYRDGAALGNQMRFSVTLKRNDCSQDVLVFNHHWGWFSNSFSYNGLRPGSSASAVANADDNERNQTVREIAEYNRLKMEFEFALATAPIGFGGFAGRAASYSRIRPGSRFDLHIDLRNKGFQLPTTSSRGYVTYRHPDGRVVTIKRAGEVIPTCPTVSSTGKKYNQRVDYEFNRLPNQSHSTGHYVQPIPGANK